MNVLYISYDGMTDPLGQSQVLPYLASLSGKSIKIVLLSCEKKERFAANKNHIEKITSSAGIIWHPLPYTKKPPVLSTWWDLQKLIKTAEKLHKNFHFDIVHCRSYIAAMVGLEMKKKYGVKFIFDMRGFWADERVDGKIWNLKNPVFRSIYNFFKKKEKEFIENADHIVTLTEAGKDVIHSWNYLQQEHPIEVIPCCSDQQLFNSANVDNQQLTALRNECDIHSNEFVLSYIGSLGTWYMLDEMMHFFQRLLRKQPKSLFLFITVDDPQVLFSAAQKFNIPQEKIRVQKSSRAQMPAFIKLSSVSIFFIKPVFSKKGSSPTKQGEIMGMGIPIVCNSNIGDTDMVIKKYRAGWIVDAFTEREYDRVIDRMLSEKIDPEKIIKGAHEFYSLKHGVEKYRKVYETWVKNGKVR